MCVDKPIRHCYSLNTPAVNPIASCIWKQQAASGMTCGDRPRVSPLQTFSPDVNNEEKICIRWWSIIHVTRCKGKDFNQDMFLRVPSNRCSDSHMLIDDKELKLISA